MAVLNVNPTRMELTRLKKQLTTAVRGHKLLKDKRDELMRRYLDLIRENRTLREEVEAEIKEANGHFVKATGVMSKESLDTALLVPKQEAYLTVGSKNVMSVDIPVYSIDWRTGDTSDVYSYGFASTSFELDEAVDRVNALEHVMIPRYRETIRMITMKLEENDRSSRARLMKVKDMMIKQTIENHQSNPDTI